MTVPTLLSSRLWMPDLDHSRQHSVPEGIVIHSGDRQDRVAESALEDGRDVSYHLAHSRKHGKLVQLVALNRRAWHAGRLGNDWLGIALAGPYTLNPRPVDEREDFRALLGELVAAWRAAGLAPLRWWCRHSDLEPGKKDPGLGFTSDWLDGFGLSWRRGPGGDRAEAG